MTNLVVGKLVDTTSYAKKYTRKGVIKVEYIKIYLVGYKDKEKG